MKDQAFFPRLFTAVQGPVYLLDHRRPMDGCMSPVTGAPLEWSAVSRGLSGPLIALEACQNP